MRVEPTTVDAEITKTLGQLLVVGLTLSLLIFSTQVLCPKEPAMVSSLKEAGVEAQIFSEELPAESQDLLGYIELKQARVCSYCTGYAEWGYIGMGIFHPILIQSQKGGVFYTVVLGQENNYYGGRMPTATWVTATEPILYIGHRMGTVRVRLNDLSSYQVRAGLHWTKHSDPIWIRNLVKQARVSLERSV